MSIIDKYYIMLFLHVRADVHRCFSLKALCFEHILSVSETSFCFENGISLTNACFGKIAKCSVWNFLSAF